MSRSLSWIENAEINERLSQLTRPVDEPVPVPRAENSDVPPGSAPSRAMLDRTIVTPMKPPVPANQDPWTMTPIEPWITVPAPPGDALNTQFPELTYPRVMALAARLELFRDWVRQFCQDGVFFVSDAEGLPLLLDGVRTSQAVTAVALERALHPLRGLMGTNRANAICIELEDGQLVQTVWADTSAGRVAVGMAPPQPLTPAATLQVRRALVGLFTDEGAQ